MKLNTAMISEIRNTIEVMNLDFEYDYIGVRVQEQPFELGKIDHMSKVWIEDVETAEYLNGICATSVDFLGLVFADCNGEYFGDHVAIICGNEAEYGTDVGEIIIRDAIVSAIIC